MHLIATVSLVLVATLMPARAQDGLAALMCQAKPTAACVLDLAAEASGAAAPEANRTPPFGRIVETASAIGHLDLALATLPKIRPSDAMALGDLTEAMTRAGRLDEAIDLLTARGKTAWDYAFVIAPVLVEMNRDAELGAFVATAPVPPDQVHRHFWFVVGNLRAGRTEEALERIRSIDGPERQETVDAAVEHMLFRPDARLLAPLLPHLQGSTASDLMRRAKIAESTGYATLARSLLPGFDGLPAEDKPFVAGYIVSALAASGAWQDAVAFTRKSVEPDKRNFTMSRIAVLSRDVKSFPLVEAALDAEPDRIRKNGIVQQLISALILTGYAPVAATYIEQADTAYEREERLRVAAVALAEAGNGPEAVRVARSIENPMSRAWILWEVASKLKP